MSEQDTIVTITPEGRATLATANQSGIDYQWSVVAIDSTGKIVEELDQFVHIFDAADFLKWLKNNAFVQGKPDVYRLRANRPLKGGN